MEKRLSYAELEQRVRDLEGQIQELECSSAALRKLKEVEELALLGHWELDLTTDTLTWSNEIYRIFDLSPKLFGATYEAFLDMVHPDDRTFVNNAFTGSLKRRTDYDIVHRLLLRDGRVKHVHEKCRTEYSDEGEPRRSLGTVQDITAQIVARTGFSGIIGRDRRMLELFEHVRDLADLDVPVLVQGESGTGKELIAMAIHREGVRAGKPFVPVNCGALPEGLLESELFGHVKGAFTGAVRTKKGRFELADGGTLFLDEVADLPKSTQVKLLRVLQEGTFERVGDEKTISVDVRIISAANRDLKREVELRNFRDDLYYRIRVVPIDLPPLRERGADIRLLVDHFIDRAEEDGLQAATVTPEAMVLMLEYPWPGNIRELQSAVHYSLIKCKGGTISPEHLPPELRPAEHGGAADGSPGRHQAHGPSTGSAYEAPLSGKLSRESVADALERTGGNKAQAARLLGVGRATLYRFLGRETP